MRILICAKKDLSGNLALNELIAGLTGHQLLVLYSEKTRPVETADPDLAMLKFLERDLPLDLLFPALEASQQAADGRPLTFDELARHHDYEHATVRSINDPATAAQIASFAPDLAISIRFSLIFKQPTIDLPRLGILNVHPGTLPAYGGLFAPFHQLRRGEPRLGCTVHWIDRGIDTGPIVAIDDLPARPERSVLWHTTRLYPLGIARVLQAVEKLEAGSAVPGRVQPSAGHGYYGFPTAAEIDAFRLRGHRLYDLDEYRELLRRYLPAQNGEAAPVFDRALDLAHTAHARRIDAGR
jgi:methionyl-tRNA formyltransferase